VAGPAGAALGDRVAELAEAQDCPLSNRRRWLTCSPTTQPYSPADVINAAATRDQVTFVTSRGRRVAGVVSVAAAERAASPDVQSDDDAGSAVMFAVNLAMLLDRGGTPSLNPAECFEDYADRLLRELAGSADRALAAARAVVAESAGKAGYPTL
jgi:hypothetical protein